MVVGNVCLQHNTKKIDTSFFYLVNTNKNMKKVEIKPIFYIYCANYLRAV